MVTMQQAAMNAIDRHKNILSSRLRCKKIIQLRKMETYLLVEALEAAAQRWIMNGIEYMCLDNERPRQM